MKCHTLVAKGESVRRALIIIKAQKDKVDSNLKHAKKRVIELEGEVDKIKEESAKALRDAKIIEEANVQAVKDCLDIEQNIVREI